MVMELMRHSDRIYTDVNLLPLGETIRSLPDEGTLTEIFAKTCQKVSRVVASDAQGESVQITVQVPSGRELSLSVRDRKWWRWRE